MFDNILILGYFFYVVVINDCRVSSFLFYLALQDKLCVDRINFSCTKKSEVNDTEAYLIRKITRPSIQTIG